MRTNVYIDGFNLYYGALRGTAHKWLNPWVMCQALLPQHQIAELKYFTANVSSRPSDPGAPTRQQAYLRALATLPNTQIVYGHFLTNEVWMPEAGVGVLNPHRKPAHKLRQVASFLKPIREGVLRASQFATTLHDANGTVLVSSRSFQL